MVQINSKRIIEVLTAFFRFYFYTIMRNDKKRFKIAVDAHEGTAVAVTPLLIFLIFVFSTLMYDLSIYYPIFASVIIANFLYAGIINNRAHSLRMKEMNEEFEKRREKVRMEKASQKASQEYFKKQQENSAKRAESSSMVNAMYLLELDEDFTVEDVKSAYRRLAKKHHPDVGGSHKNFLKLQKAYNYVLKNM